MSYGGNEFIVKRLLRQQGVLTSFSRFALRERDLHVILTEAARLCAVSFDVTFGRICRYRAAEDDLLIEADYGWDAGMVGRVVSQANEGSPQGRAYVSGQPVIIRNLMEANNLPVPNFYAEHGIVSTVTVVIAGVDGPPYGVLEIGSSTPLRHDVHDINFLTGFANILAEAVATSRRLNALESLIHEKSLLAEELQHRVRNNLQMVSSMLSNYGRTATSDEARRGIKQIITHVTILAQIYNSLLGVGLSSTIDLGAYLHELCRNLPELQHKQRGRVSLTCQAEPVLLALDGVTTLGMVVAELVTNSYGHAFPEQGGNIVVTLLHTPDQRRATLTIQDDGVGFFVETGSLRRGLSLVRRLVDHVKGTLEVQSVNGTLWTLQFEVPDHSGSFKAAA